MTQSGAQKSFARKAATLDDHKWRSLRSDDRVRLLLSFAGEFAALAMDAVSGAGKSAALLATSGAAPDHAIHPVRGRLWSLVVTDAAPDP